MDLVRCTLDNKVYNAVEFSKLSDLSKKRKYLICEECKYSAYFKKASKSGQAACFGARPHKEGCSMATEDSDTAIGILTETEKELVNNGNEIKVDFSFETQPVTHTREVKEDVLQTSRVGFLHSSKNGIGKAKSIRRLSSLLNMLINDPNFLTSNRKIDLGYNDHYYASYLFRENNFLSAQDVDQVKGVYGQIIDVQLVNKKVTNDVDVKSEEKFLWLNFGGYNECSIIISDFLIESFFNRFIQYKDNTKELNGKFVLCFGVIKKSKKNKFYIHLDDVSKIVFK